jgi:protein-S-isoprenylcysteine O-methyltransferase Ste14
MGSRGRSYMLVGVQFFCLGAIALSGPGVPTSPVWGLLTMAGVLLGVWAVLAMRIPDVSILPEVRAGAQLVTRGPYSVIRHPMYSALLLVGLGLVLDAPSLLRWLLWLVLLVDLLFKLNYEERLLAGRFSDYQAYQQRTWRIIPFIY